MIISPKSDVAMKELFRNKKILRYFLSDIMEIPQEEIYAIHLKDTFLRRRWRWQKLGILDIVLELNYNTKVNIELQVKFFENWDKRQIFYLARLYSQDLLSGEAYDNLKRCVGISILDFDLSDRPECHTIYTLRDKNGNKFSDVLEIHVLELKKAAAGNSGAEEWIRFFNAKTEEDLDMIKTNNPGILEAIGELRRMSLKNPLRLWYEAYMKSVRDDRAWRNYVWKQAMEEGLEEGRKEGHKEGREEGHKEGREEGRKEGREEGREEGLVRGEEYKLVKQICKKLRRGKGITSIAEELEEESDRIAVICNTAKAFAPEYDAKEVMEALITSGKDKT